MNAVVHKAYEAMNPIQIKVFDDKVYIFNDARLPAGITEKDLQEAHKSTPHNPLIANAFFRSGQIEAWGRGIEKIKAACAADGLPEPEFRITATDFLVCFHIRNNNKAITERANANRDNLASLPVSPAIAYNEGLPADEKARDMFESREKRRRDAAAREDGARQKGRAEGRAEGLAEGRAEERHNTAQRLLKMNLPVENVVAGTGLTLDEVESLRKAL